MTRWRSMAALAGCAAALAAGPLLAADRTDPDSGPDVRLARQLEIQAPQRIQTATRLQPDNALRIAIDKDGVLHLPPGAEDLDELLEHLARRGQTNPALPVRLLVDRRAKLGPVAMLLDQCDTYGLSEASIYLTASTALPVSAPTPGKPALILRLDRDGSIYHGKTRLDGRKLAAAVQAASPSRVQLRADRRCTAAAWAQAIDQLRTAGAQAIRTTADIDALDIRTRVQPVNPMLGEQTPAASAARHRKAHLKALAERLAQAHDRAKAALAVRDRMIQTAGFDAEQLPAVELPERDLEGPVALAEIHQRCCRIESAVEEIRRQLRAIPYARREDLPLREALKFHQTPTRIHLPLDDAEILAAGRKIQDKQDHRRYMTALKVLGHRNKAVTERIEQMAKPLAAAPFAGVDPEDAAMTGYKGPDLMPDEMTFSVTPRMGAEWFKKLQPSRQLHGENPKGRRYVDSWFILGPLPASPADRQSLAPPAVQTDLAGRWRGKDGKPVSWQYVRQGQSPNGTGHKISPARVHDYATYFARTQIVSDRARQVWIATGADDYGALWVNGKLVWTSAPIRRPYNAVENIQQIQLRKGVNDILVRVINGAGTMGFSLLCFPDETSEK